MDSQKPRDLSAEIEELRQKIVEMEKIWARFEGASMLAKLTFWVAGPIVAAILFIKDHWKP